LHVSQGSITRGGGWSDDKGHDSKSAITEIEAVVHDELVAVKKSPNMARALEKHRIAQSGKVALNSVNPTGMLTGNRCHGRRRRRAFHNNAIAANQWPTPSTSGVRRH